MIIIDPPITKSRVLRGFTVLEYVDRPPTDSNGNYGYVNASIRLHYDDGSYEDMARTLWDGAATPPVITVVDGQTIEVSPAIVKEFKYADAGDWTRAQAEARIEAILTGKK